MGLTRMQQLGAWGWLTALLLLALYRWFSFHQ